MDAQLVIAATAIIGAITTVAAFIAGGRERKANVISTQALAASNISEAFNRLNDALEQRIEYLEAERKLTNEVVETLKRTVQKLEEKVSILEDEIDVLEKDKKRLAEENSRLVKRITVLENGASSV